MPRDELSRNELDRDELEDTRDMCARWMARCAKAETELAAMQLRVAHLTNDKDRLQHELAALKYRVFIKGRL